MNAVVEAAMDPGAVAAVCFLLFVYLVSEWGRK